MLAYQQSHGFDDFYNSIQDSYETNEGFGREVRQQIHKPKYAKGFKKIVSVENFNGHQNYENNDPKSFSTSTFEDNDNDFTPYKKSNLTYIYEDQSTMSSFSAFNSMSSMSSMNGVCHNSYKCSSKNKFFVPKKKVMIPGETDFRVKYKTEVCKYWAQTGHCTFGDNCAFAHGNAEIRQKLHISSNYKTKKCVQFHENGICPYGIRCQFIHCARKENQLNPALKSTSYAEDLEHIDIWCIDDADCHCMKRKNRARLPCLVKMASEGVSTDDSDN